MPRRSHPLQIVRIAMAALLGAAALLCAGLWIADALRPRPAAIRPSLAPSPDVLQLGSSRYVLIVRLADGRLELRCSANACWLCAHFNPNHDRNCPGPASSIVFDFYSRRPRTAHNIAILGFDYSDRWAAPAGLLSANLYVSLWLLIALLAPYPLYVLARGLLRRHSRRRPGVCAACGYDLTGNVSGICPECGRPAVAAP